MNANEQLVADYLTKKGHRVLRRGWPDFLCVKQEYNRIMKQYTGRFTGVLAVEVKAGKDTLSEEQKIAHAVLKMAGIPTYVIRPEEVQRGNRAVGSAALRLWSKQEVDSIGRRLSELEFQQRARQKEIDELRAIIKDCAVMFEETNYLLENMEPVDVD